MVKTSSVKKRRSTSPALSREIGESAESERALILKSMQKWEMMDAQGILMGRGLGRKELIERVALEVGKSLRCVHSALKSKA